MSVQTLQKLVALWDAEERNFGMVEERLRLAGVAAPPALIASIAKYYEALQRLSAE
ncbi:MAG TPA: hypothetical protein VLW48_00750 [Candidatus Bathyarchaeia archaeon]|nr:hypothetical protein [Candidatus Bathyarchaeia archaeon]